MLAKTQMLYLRRSFEKYVESILESKIYCSYLDEIKIEFFTSSTVTRSLTFDPTEIPLVVKELEKKGWKVHVENPEQINQEFYNVITIF